MSILRREDGVNFVLQPYRETLAIKNTSLLRKEVRYLSEQQGEYARLFKHKGYEYEAVFSKESGFLLGETIWHHFKEPQELIYCEVLNHDVLLVVVREGKVYLDTKLSLEALSEELSGLLTEITGRYEAYVYGNLPDIFEHPAIKKLNKLEHSVFRQLAVNSSFQLLPLEQALDEQGLILNKRSSLIILTTACVMILGALWWYVHSQESPIQINPFEQYELALQTPNPQDQIDALVDNIQKVNSIEGWYTSSITYNGQVATMPLHSLGGSATDLMSAAQSLNLTVNFSQSGASIAFPVMLQGRATPDKIANVQHTIAIVIDRMMKILPGKSVQINETTSNSVFSQTGITISFNKASPQVLELIGNSLYDLPVVLTTVNANIKDGLFSGNVQLNVVGN